MAITRKHQAKGVACLTPRYGINIHYEARGSGSPLWMMVPGGFDSTIEKWIASGIRTSVKPLETITNRYTCIPYDHREAGIPGGKVERVSWTA